MEILNIRTASEQDVEMLIKKVKRDFKDVDVDTLYIIEFTEQELHDHQEFDESFQSVEELLDEWNFGSGYGYLKLNSGNFLYATCHW